jgi:hypothetical protein
LFLSFFSTFVPIGRKMEENLQKWSKKR